MRHFSQILEDHVAHRGWSLRSFADRVGISHTVFNKIKKGTIPPTTTRLDGWADALHLEGVEREEFMVAGWLANAPPQLAQYIALKPPHLSKTGEQEIPYEADPIIAEMKARLTDLEHRLAAIRALTEEQ